MIYYIYNTSIGGILSPRICDSIYSRWYVGLNTALSNDLALMAIRLANSSFLINNSIVDFKSFKLISTGT